MNRNHFQILNNLHLRKSVNSLFLVSSIAFFPTVTFGEIIEISLDNSGVMNAMTYISTDDLSTMTYIPSEGYYAYRDSEGRYGALYLDINDGVLSFIDSEAQTCSSTDSFVHETGCNASGGGTVTTTGASIFDGAGSLISPAEDCFGCDKDSALMHPHERSTSTVVFQWREIPGCRTLAIGASSSLSMTLSAKTWASPEIKETYQATISENNVFSLNSLGEWTTFSITSTSPITDPIYIYAMCADGFMGTSSPLLDPTPVKVDRGARWMGTGSIISKAEQGNINGYGVYQDMSIGSRGYNALTSFQWYASPSCSALRIGDGVNASVTVSSKAWDEASFKQICPKLPCDISADYADYYVIKLESSAGAFPVINNFKDGRIRAVCQ